MVEQFKSGSGQPYTDDTGFGSKPKASLAAAATQASNAALDEVKALGNEAQNIAGEQADKVKDAAVSHMDAFANALKTAAEELAQKQSGPASELVSHAAAGLESLSRSFHGKSAAQMIDAVRQFGRANPIGFLAGSVLAGVALGRFAAAGSTGTVPAERGSHEGAEDIARGNAS